MPKDTTRDAPRKAVARAPSHRGGSDQALTLAQAFELMRQSLGELGSPVAGEMVRNRMTALYGRNDPLLEKARFELFLRQVHDAEVADVKKLGDDDYEISTRPGFKFERPVSAVSAASEAVAPTSGAGTAPKAAASGNGKRPGLRFRRGARGGITRQEIPMVGVVTAEAPVPAPAEKAERKAASGRRPTRGKGRKPKGAVETPAAVVSAAPAETATAVRKPRRPRARKE